MYFLAFRYTFQFVCARWADGQFAPRSDPYKNALSLITTLQFMNFLHTMIEIVVWEPAIHWELLLNASHMVPRLFLRPTVYYIFLLFPLFIQGNWGLRTDFPKVTQSRGCTPSPARTSESALPPEKAYDVGQWCVSILQMKKVEAPGTMNKSHMLQSWK